MNTQAQTLQQLEEELRVAREQLADLMMDTYRKSGRRVLAKKKDDLRDLIDKLEQEIDEWDDYNVGE